MNAKKRGRPAKKLKRNISGLRNQPRAPPGPPILSSDRPASQASWLEPQGVPTVPEVEEKIEADHEEEEALSKSDNDSKGELYVRIDKAPREKPMKMIKKVDENAEWLPPKLQKHQGQKRGRPNEYIKGPDSMSKAPRTQSRHKKAWINQTRLDTFFVNRSGAGNDTAHREVVLNSGQPNQTVIPILTNDGPST